MPDRIRQRLVTALIALTYVPYAVAFFLPAAERSQHVFYGYLAFLEALCFAWCVPIWWMNPLLWFATWALLRGKPMWALAACTAGLYCGLGVIWFFSSGTYVIKPLIGYQLWMACPIMLAVGASVLSIADIYRDSASKAGLQQPAA